MYSTIRTERVRRSGGPDVKDPVLNIVTASEDNDNGIEPL